MMEREGRKEREESFNMMERKEIEEREERREYNR
jgi:hypothetical protein